MGEGFISTSAIASLWRLLLTQFVVLVKFTSMSDSKPTEPEVLLELPLTDEQIKILSDKLGKPVTKIVIKDGGSHTLSFDSACW